MDANEREVYYYLKSRKDTFESLRDITRYAGSKQRARWAPDWAVPVLERMVERGILEYDGKDGFRLKPIPESETKGKVWASPAMTKILQKSGKEFEQLRQMDSEDDYYDRL